MQSTTTQASKSTVRAIAYVRVSTAQQAQEGLSLVAQRDAIEKFCQQKGWELACVCHDAGISGKRIENRPGLLRALGFLRAGLADSLVILRLDRLSRSMADLARVLRDADGKWDLVSLSENLDTSTPSGRLVVHVLGSLCQYEQEITGQRTREGLAVLKEQGKLRGAVPYGYVLDEDGKTLVPDAQEQRTVRKIVALRQKKGAGFAVIATILNAVSTPARGEKFYPRTVWNIYEANKHRTWKGPDHAA